MRALILTGRIRHGFDQQQVWAKAAALFKLNTEAFGSRILSRLPLAIRESDEESVLGQLRTALQDAGAEVDQVEADGKWLLHDGSRIAGPVPLSYLAKEFGAARISLDTKIKQTTDSEWTTLTKVLSEAQLTFDVPAALETINHSQLPRGESTRSPPNMPRIDATAIYVYQGETRLGPFSDDEVKAKYRSGQFAALNQIWHEGLENWISLKEYASKRGWGDQAMPPDAPKSHKEYINLKCKECGFSGQMGVKGVKTRWWASKWLWGGVAAICFILQYELNVEIQTFNSRHLGTTALEYVTFPWWVMAIYILIFFVVQAKGTKKIVDCPSCGKTLTQL